MSAVAQRFGSGQSVRRIEDPALVAGKGQFTDDVAPVGQTFLSLQRSPYPHARIAAIDTNNMKATLGTKPWAGATPEERAATRMWVRRLDLNIIEPMANGFRYAEGLAIFKNRMRTIPQAADDLKAIAREKLAWLDGQMQGPWIVGDRFTLADILLFGFLEFGAQVGQKVDGKLLKLNDWYGRVAARESVATSK